MGKPVSQNTPTRSIVRLISSADFELREMPPTAVLLIRRMSDPLPGHSVSPRNEAKINPAWERAFRDSLVTHYRQAYHPVTGQVPSNAKAVVFNDESELLACLLRDVTHGNVLQRWWWQCVLRNGSLGRKPSSQGEVVEAIARQMTQKAHLVPGLLNHLEVWGQASLALRILSDDQAGQVLQAVLRAYMLPRLAEGKSPGPPYLPPWSPVRILKTGGRERTALLGLCLDLQARPQQVRASSYQRQLQAWWRNAGTAEIIQQEEMESPVVTSKTQLIAPSTPPFHNQPEISVEHQPLVRPEMSSTADIAASSMGDGQAQPAQDEAKASGAENAMGKQRSLRLANESRVQANVENQVPVMQPESESPSSVLQPEIFAWLSAGVPTRLGGVLYLINLMTHLDLPGCFEEDWHLSSRLGPWGLLEVLARALLGEAIEGFEDDPLWRALAHLDGRDPDELPGLLMSRSRPRRWIKFRVPEPWLRGLPSDAVRLSRTRHGSKHSRNISGSPWLQRWLDLALPFIAYRLRLALRLPEEASLAEYLLIMPGRIYVTSSHVDLAASVEQISLPVRLAGLDRDPGWMPEFGRVIYFHFLE